MNFDTIGIITNIFSSIAVLIAIVQFTREIRTQNHQSFFYLHEYLSQDVFSVARRNIRTMEHGKPYEKWNVNDKNNANYICTSYDQAGILIEIGAIDKKTAVNFLKTSWGDSIIDQYELLSPYLDAKQTPTQYGRDFFRHFYLLYLNAKQVRINPKHKYTAVLEKVLKQNDC
jgi:hypothetical protein